jgi:L-aminopeptidase/D-esterase-like protein
VLIDETKALDGLFRAVVESVKEAIVNSLFGAETMAGRDNHVVLALPFADVSVPASLATNSRRRDTP